MILGLDVGGTQTDTVLVDETGVVAATKTPTGDNLLDTLRQALDRTLFDTGPAQIERMVFSTTMATNAIVQKRLHRAGMIVSGGPGIDPRSFSVGPCYNVVTGCLDHQGFEAEPIDRDAVRYASKRIKEQGIDVLGIACKFSVRNPAHELKIADMVSKDFSYAAMGHQVSGSLNFPRRIFTTYLNSALFPIHKRFLGALTHILNEKALNAHRYLLKPDGGTFELNKSVYAPARTAQSGPAASVMGAIALDGCRGASLVLDIGGTTTDMSFVLDGEPLFDRRGIKLGTYPTLIRSLLTRSIGVGGDSLLTLEKDGSFSIGPFRQGKPIAFGGPGPTPTDAMVSLGLLKKGNATAAINAMGNLGRPLGLDPLSTSERILETMAYGIAEAASSFTESVNSAPLYTINDLLKEQKIKPSAVVIIGGPAPQIAPYIGRALGLPARVPDHFGVANAVGAAVARVTSVITLQADTERGTVIIPEVDMEKPIDQTFDINDAIKLADKELRKRAVQIGADTDSLEISITEQQVFNMIRGYYRAGQNIRLKMCITPGLISGWKQPGKSI